MNKKTLFGILLLFQSGSLIAQNAPEDSIQAIIQDPLIVICEQNDSLGVKNFENVDFSSYTATDDFDLLRRTQLSSILAQVNSTPVLAEIEQQAILIDTQHFIFQGDYSITTIPGSFTLIKGDTIANCRKVVLNEQYNLSSYGEIAATYNNLYYFFIDSTMNNVLLEVFDRKRVFKGNYLYHHVGIEGNAFTETTDIELSVNPNPATNEVAIEFELWQSDAVTIHISNQSGSVYQLIESDYFDSGYNTVLFNTQNLAIGTYTILVDYQGQSFSTNLIKQ
jgi:hypothetical protein